MFKKITKFFWKNELKKLEIFEKDYSKLKKLVNKCIIMKKKYLEIIENQENLLKEFLLKDKEKNIKLYKNWELYNPKYKCYDDLIIPPNTLITINDVDIKLELYKNNFHKLEFEELIWILEKWINNFITYKSDIDLWDRDERWMPASYTFKKRQGDCEDYSILYQTCMHILGYGDKCVVIVNKVDFGKSFKGGHAYNKVLINDKWVIVDPTNPKNERSDDWEYDIPHEKLNWFFNYWGTYRIKNNGILNKER